MAELKNFEKLVATLRAKAAKQASCDAQVGYTASYALWVDQNRNAKHKVGRAGFLTDVARETAGKLAELAATLLKRSRTMTEAILACALQLQRDSQKEAPVLTGNLKNSAFTRLVPHG